MLNRNSTVKFWFDGVSNEDVGIRVSGFPTISGAEKNITRYNVPGRNGEITIWDGTYKNVKCEMKCYATSKNNIADIIDAVNSWISTDGYKRFEISSEPGRYRIAQVTGGSEISVLMGVATPFTINFNCKPQRFYTDDNTITITSSGGTIHNQTMFTSKPIIRCILSKNPNLGADEIYFENDSGQTKIRLGWSEELRSAEWIDIDFDTKSVTTNSGNNVPIEEITAEGFAPGFTRISVGNGGFFTSFIVNPRWWTL